jgi:hypothetical protein
VPATGGRRGRRDNGLVAAEYAAVGDIDPRVGEHLLDVLAAGGIAAYLQPSTDQHPITGTTSLPARPTDRLFVDREHAGTAKEYVRQVQADPERQAARTADAAPRTASDAEVEDAFRAIVAGFHRDVDREQAAWPDAEEIVLDEPRLLPPLDLNRLDLGLDGARLDGGGYDGPGYDGRGRDVAGAHATPDRIEPDEPGLLDALDTFGAGLPGTGEDDEGYTPPPPPPLPRISAAATLGVLMIAFGLVLFVFPDLLPLDGDTTLLVAFGSIVAGFGTLIWRLRPGDDDEDDLDDGARV